MAKENNLYGIVDIYVVVWPITYLRKQNYLQLSGVV